MTRRILMIAGSDYTDTIVCAHAKHLQLTGKYCCSSLGAGGDGQPGTFDHDLFNEVHSFPFPETRPRSLRGGMRLAKACITSSLGMCFPNDRAEFAASSKDRIRERLYRDTLARDLPKLVQGYDIYQWHCFSPERLPALRLFPNDAKIVIAVWGSDLLRTSGVQSYARQLEACKRATRIVVASVEMREILLSKFGRQFIDKVRMAYIGTDMLDTIDIVRENARTFLVRNNIPTDKVVVCVGNNASPSNQHVEVLKELSQIEAKHRDRLAIILPLTYGATDDYLAELRKAVEQSPLNVTTLTEVLSSEDVARFRCCTDVHVSVPISDAFSGAMTEAMYGGATVLTGDWLPYSMLRREGIHYHEVSNVTEIADKMNVILNNLSNEQHQSAAQAASVRSLRAWDSVIAGWDKLYEELF